MSQTPHYPPLIVQSIIKTKFPTPPSQKDYLLFRATGQPLPSDNAIRKRYGSWKQFVKLMYGYETSPESHSPQQCLAAIEECLREINDSFTQARYEQWRKSYPPGTYPSRYTIIRQIGSWQQAVEPFGIKPTICRRSTPEEMIQGLQACALSLKSSQFTSRQYLIFQKDHPHHPSLSSISSTYSTFSNAMKAAGLTASSRPIRHSREKCLADIQFAAKQCNGELSFQTYRSLAISHNLTPGTTLLRRFSGWSDAIAEAGVSSPNLPSFSDEKIAECLQQACRELGVKRLTPLMYLSWYETLKRPKSIPHLSTIESRYGGLNKAFLKLAPYFKENA